MLRPVWITFQRCNFAVVVDVVVVVFVSLFVLINSTTIANGQLSLLKSDRNWPYNF